MSTNQKQHRQPKQAQRKKPRQPGPESQGPEALQEQVDLQVLQRAVADPDMATPADVLALQRRYGNRAVLQLLRQRPAGEGFALDDETAGRINRARGGGQPLDAAVQTQMSETLSHDFSGVRVHTDAEADDLSGQLQAKAFTTGRDIFFQRGAYEPGSSGGRELIAHELSHVVQQSTGRVSGGGTGMTVRPAVDDVDLADARVASHRTQQRLGTWAAQRLQQGGERQRKPATIRALNGGDGVAHAAQSLTAQLASSASAEPVARRTATVPELATHRRALLSVQPLEVTAQVPNWGGVLVQRKLSEKAERKFRDWVRDNLPTLEDAVVNDLVASQVDFGYAMREAKKKAFEKEESLLKSDPRSTSVSQASRSMVDELIATYSPAEHHYVLLGGSPAVLDQALKDKGCAFSHLPLGGLTDFTELSKVFKEPSGDPQEMRPRMLEYMRSPAGAKLAEYLMSFLSHIKEPNLVLIDYTQSGGSIVIAADLLRAAMRFTGDDKRVKLFTFSGKAPDEGSLLTKQVDYSLVALTPEGPHERTFITLSDYKAYKDKLKLIAYGSLKLAVLADKPSPSYADVLETIKERGGADKLAKL